MKVLVVDDEDMMRAMLVEFFEMEDHTVASARDGLESIAAYTSFSPDVIILDIMMPNMDGFEVCKKIRSEFQDKETKIFMLTAKGGVDVECQGLELGANKVLFKPMSMDELLHVVTANS